MKNLIISTLVLMLTGAAFGEVFYENDFSADPFTAASPWTNSYTGSSRAIWSGSTTQAIWLYSPDKTSQANAYSPTISGQGTEYQVTVQFKPSYVGSYTSDNSVYICEPMSTAGSIRDITIALAYTSGVKDPKLAIRSTVSADIYAWSYQDAIFPLVAGTSYEVKYVRTEGSNIIQAWARETAGASWTQLKNSLGEDFTIVNGQSAASTFDKIHSGLANNSSVYQAYFEGITVASVPEPATMVLLGAGSSLIMLRKRK